MTSRIQPGTEVRVKDPSTGGEKGRKLARFGLLPHEALWEIAEHYGVGASKYDDHNWRRGFDWSLSYDALQRHLALWWSGEDIDPESGTHHLAAAGFHVLTLLTFVREHPEGDDRWRGDDAEVEEGEPDEEGPITEENPYVTPHVSVPTAPRVPYWSPEDIDAATAQLGRKIDPRWVGWTAGLQPY